MLVLASFGYKYTDGNLEGVELTYDCRVLQNPWGVLHLRALDGRSAAVQQFVQGDPAYKKFFNKVVKEITAKTPTACVGKRSEEHYFVSFGCLGGKHRSVAMAEIVGRHFKNLGWGVGTSHLILNPPPSLNVQDIGVVNAL